MVCSTDFVGSDIHTHTHTLQQTIRNYLAEHTRILKDIHVFIHADNNGWKLQSSKYTQCACFFTNMFNKRIKMYFKRDVAIF